VTYEAKCDDTGTGTFTATSAVSPIIVSGLTPYSAYNCSIAAVNAAGTGPVSSYANMTTSINNLTGSAQNTAQATSPSEPTNLTAAYTSGWINMSYNAPILNGGHTLQGYYAACAYPDGTTAVSPVVSSTTLAIGVQATAAQATHAICSVVASNNYYSGTSYYTGHQNQYGPAAALVIGLPLAPNTPRWSTTPGMINVSYSAPSIASASPITGYTAACTATGHPTCTGTVSGSTYAIGVPSCDAGVQYQCSVAAQNASGIGTQSMLQTVTTQGVAAVAPDAPTNLSLLAYLNVSIMASFIEGYDGGSQITGYRLTCTNTNSGVSSNATGTTSPITLSGLKAGSTYSCSVQAQNSVGFSLSSATSSKKLPSSGPGPHPL
jgi:titin